jgi:hypothetical protein
MVDADRDQCTAVDASRPAGDHDDTSSFSQIAEGSDPRRELGGTVAAPPNDAVLAEATLRRESRPPAAGGGTDDAVDDPGGDAGGAYTVG